MSLSQKQKEAKRVTTGRAVKKAAAAVKEAREKARDMEVTSVGEWKKDSGDQGVESKLALPSGHVCVVKRVSMQTFIEKGMIPNALLPIVLKSTQGEGMSKSQVADIMSDNERLKDMMNMADSVVCDVVVAPKITPNDVRDTITSDKSLTAAAKKKKLAEHLFADEVDINDKMFIYQFAVGGSRDLETFRRGQDAPVAGVDGQQAVPTETE